MRLLAAFVLVTACSSSDGADAFQATVPVTIHVEAANVSGGQLEGTGDIGAQAGDPYRAFIEHATSTLGAAPTHVAVTGVTLSLGSASVETLADVLISDIALGLETEGDGLEHPIATRATIATGHVATPTVPSGFTTDALDAGGFDDVLGGRFAVHLHADANSQFTEPDSAADVVVSIAFDAS